MLNYSGSVAPVASPIGSVYSFMHCPLGVLRRLLLVSVAVADWLVVVPWLPIACVLPVVAHRPF